MQHQRLQIRNGLHSLSLDPAPESAPDRGVGVRTEVEAVMPVHRLEQQLDLDAFQLRIVFRRRPGQLPDHPSGLRLVHRYSHTRMRLRSCSTSTGFVM